ncbi:MAG: SBBP repeat-containing protein [Promethearchaeota archaeon]
MNQKNKKRVITLMPLILLLNFLVINVNIMIYENSSELNHKSTEGTKNDGEAGAPLISALTSIAQFLEGNSSLSFDIVNDIAYIADGSNGLWVYNVSDPYNPVPLSHYSDGGIVRAVDVVGDRVYTADEADGLEIFNVSNPNSITKIGSWNYSGRAWDLDIQGDLAYIADFEFDLEIVNLSKSVLDFSWDEFWGGSAWDNGESIAFDSENNVYVVGHTKSYTAGYSDLVLIKYDNLGNFKWYKTLGGIYGDNEQNGYDIEIDSSDNIYVVGFTGISGNPDTDVLIAKYNTMGDLQWYSSWGGTGTDKGFELELDELGNIYITGFTKSYGEGGSDMVLLKFNSTGNCSWYRTLGGGNDDEGRSIILDDVGNIYITGNTKSYGAQLTDVLIAKYDNSGNRLWNYTWGEYDDDAGFGIDIDNLGNLYVVGLTDSYTIGGRDILFMKFTNSGSVTWNLTWGGTNDEEGVGVCISNDGYVFFSGKTRSKGAGGYDVVLAKYDTSGNEITEKIWGGTSDDIGRRLGIDKFNNIYVTGETQSYGAGNCDSFLNKYLSYSEAGRFDNGGEGRDVEVVGNMAYLADYYDGLEIINCTNLGSLNRIGQYYDGGNSENVKIVDNLAYIADGPDGLEIINISDPSLPDEIGSIVDSSSAIGLDVMGDFALISDGNDMLEIINISDMSNLFEYDEWDNGGYSEDLFIYKGFVYLGTNNGVYVFNLTNLFNKAAIHQFKQNGKLLWEEQSGPSNRVHCNAIIDDIDGDGYQDVLTGTESSESMVFCRSGVNGSEIWNATYATDDVAYIEIMDDIDKDGYRDVAYCSEDLNVYAVSGKNGTLIWSQLVSSAWQNGIKAVDDIDDDGYVDLVVISDDTNMRCLSGANGSNIWTFSDAIFVLAHLFITPDIDHQSKNDIVVSGSDGIFLVSGETGDYIWDLNSTENIDNINLVSDLDGDLLNDIIFDTSSYLYAISSFDSSLIWKSMVHGFPIAFGDINLDKIDDIALTRQAVDYILVIDGISAEVLWNSSAPNGYTGGYYGLEILDIDGDDVNDLAFFTWQSQTGIFCMSGKSGQILWKYATSNYVTWNAQYLEDVDGDGVVEIIIGDGDVKTYCVSGEILIKDHQNPIIEGINQKIYIKQSSEYYIQWNITEVNNGTYVIMRNGSDVSSGDFYNWVNVSMLVNSSIIGDWNYTIIATDPSNNTASFSTIIQIYDDDLQLLMPHTVYIINITEIGVYFNISTMSMSFLNASQSKSNYIEMEDIPDLMNPINFYLFKIYDENLLINDSLVENLTIRFYFSSFSYTNINNLRILHRVYLGGSIWEWQVESSFLNSAQKYLEISIDNLSYFCLAEILEDTGSGSGNDDNDDDTIPEFNIIILIIILSALGALIPTLYIITHKKKEKEDDQDKLDLSKKAKLKMDPLKNSLKEGLEDRMEKESEKQVFPPQVVDKPMKSVKKLKRVDEIKPFRTAEEDLKLSRELQDTEKELNLQEVVDVCQVHRGPIKGISYICPKCRTKYCLRCATILAKKSEECWVCGETIQISLEKKEIRVKFDEDKEKSLKSEGSILKVFKGESIIEKLSSLNDINLTALSRNFFKQVELLEWEENDKFEFIKEMLALTPEEREEFLSEMLSESKLNESSNDEHSKGG